MPLLVPLQKLNMYGAIKLSRCYGHCSKVRRPLQAGCNERCCTRLLGQDVAVRQQITVVCGHGTLSLSMRVGKLLAR